MSKNLIIGAAGDDATPFSLPESALLDHIGIVGKTGSGKTYKAKLIVEGLLERKHTRMGIVDPTSAWWGMRLLEDGKTAAYPMLICGGPYGDVPLVGSSGKAMGEMMAEPDSPLTIFDTKGMTVRDRTVWMRDFAETLLMRNKAPLHLVIDEIHNFAPQGKVPDPLNGQMLHNTNELFSAGRAQGIRCIGISQRPAKWHKDGLTSVGTLLAMKVIAPQDRQQLKEWFDGAGDPKQARQIMDTLAMLKSGEGWLWYPEGDVLCRLHKGHAKLRTFDSSKTPEYSSTVTTRPRSFEDIDLAALKKKMGEAEKVAQENDPKWLRGQIETLRRQLQEQDMDPASKELLREIARTQNALTDAIISLTSEVRAGFSRVLGLTPPTITALSYKVAPVFEHGADGSPVTVPAPEPDRKDRVNGERRILIACAQNGSCSREQLTALTGYKRSTRDKYIQKLAADGLLDTQNNRIAITPEGLKHLGDYEKLPTGRDLYHWWMQRLPDGERKILGYLFTHYPVPCSRESISTATGYKRSTRDKYIQRLANQRLVAATHLGVSLTRHLMGEAA